MRRIVIVSAALILFVCASGKADAVGPARTAWANIRDRVEVRREVRQKACAPTPVVKVAATTVARPAAPSCSGGSCPAPARRGLFR